MQPVTHFEYYSENLKKQYRESPSDPDLDFLNNIEKNVFDRTTDKYKWIWVKCFLYEYITSRIHMPKYGISVQVEHINDDDYYKYRIGISVFHHVYVFR